MSIVSSFVCLSTVVYQTTGDMLRENWRVVLGLAVVGVVAWVVERIRRRRWRRMCKRFQDKT